MIQCRGLVGQLPGQPPGHRRHRCTDPDPGGGCRHPRSPPHQQRRPATRRLPPEGLDLLHHPGRGVLGTLVGEGDIGPALRQRDRRGRTDSTAAARHQCRLADPFVHRIGRGTPHPPPGRGGTAIPSLRGSGTVGADWLDRRHVPVPDVPDSRAAGRVAAAVRACPVRVEPGPGAVVHVDPRQRPDAWLRRAGTATDRSSSRVRLAPSGVADRATASAAGLRPGRQELLRRHPPAADLAQSRAARGIPHRRFSSGPC